MTLSWAITDSGLQPLPLAFILTMTMMFLVWLYSEKIKNGGIVDVFWGLGFSLVAAVYFAFYTYFVRGGWMPRKITLLLMVALWSLRLTFFLLGRFLRHYPEEDGRYASFRKEWGARASLGMLGAFQLQAVLLASLTMPFSIVMHYSEPEFKSIEWVAILIWLVAFIGETLADHQLDSFKKDPANRGKVCQVGLWAYSRHPNYFFEWLTWISFCLFAMTSVEGFYTLYCPLVMYYFLTQVTGVKATEEQALRTKGDAYAAYQKSTSAFFPWFKK